MFITESPFDLLPNQVFSQPGLVQTRHNIHGDCNKCIVRYGISLFLVHLHFKSFTFIITLSLRLQDVLFILKAMLGCLMYSVPLNSSENVMITYRKYNTNYSFVCVCCFENVCICQGRVLGECIKM